MSPASHPPAMSVTAGTASQARSDAPLGYAPGLGASPLSHSSSSSSVGTVGSRPSAQVAPYSATPTVGGATQHSVINVDEGTSARGQQDRSGLFSSRSDTSPTIC